MSIIAICNNSLAIQIFVLHRLLSSLRILLSYYQFHSCVFALLYEFCFQARQCYGCVTSKVSAWKAGMVFVSEQSAAWPYCLADCLQVMFVLTTMIHKRCLVLYELSMANWMKGQKAEAASCSVRSRGEQSL